MKAVAFAASALLLIAGPQWTVQPSQTAGARTVLRGASAVSDKVAWATGSGDTVLRTNDGGATWVRQTVSSDGMDFRDVDAINERVAYVLSINFGPKSRIYKTTDGGASWTRQYMGDDLKIFLDAMTFSDEQHGFVMGDSIDGQFLILRTDNGGAAWTRIPPASLPPALPNEGAFAGSGTNVAVFGSHVWIGTGAAARCRVLHSADRGRTWTVADTPIIASENAGIFSVAFRDATHGVIVGGDYRKTKDAVDNLATTSDGGKTWTPVKDRALSGFRSVVAYVPRASTPSLVAVGPAGSDYSTDDGRTWTPIEGPGFNAFSFSPSGKLGWGTGDRGAIGLLTLPR